MLWEVHRLHREGRLKPESVDGIGDLPARPSRPMRRLHEWVTLSFGLLLAEGVDGAMMVACSVLVDEGIVLSKGGASYLLNEAERLGIIWSPSQMPARGTFDDGTKLWMPGRRPNGPEPPEGWLGAGLRVLPALSDDAPSAVLEPAPVAVEAEDVAPAIAVDPAVELPDEPGVRDAVADGTRGGVVFALHRGVAAGDAASDLTGHDHEHIGAGGGGDSGPLRASPTAWGPDDELLVRRLVEELDAVELDDLGRPLTGEDIAEPRAVAVVDCDRPGHRGEAWRRQTSNRWTCGACHPPMRADVVWEADR